MKTDPERTLNLEPRTLNFEQKSLPTCAMLRRSRFKVRSSKFKVWIASAFVLLGSTFASRAAEPLRALLITGGCCHDYEAQKKTLTEGIGARANVTWTIVHEGDNDARTHEFSIYKKSDWAKGFDVVVHNECSGQVTNIAWVEHIAKAHFEGVPAVVIHCSIHSSRESRTDEWRKTLGVSSYRHQPRRAFEVVNVRPEHPIMKTFPAKWHDDSDELYEIVKVWPDCIPLAKSITPKKEDDLHPSIWINTYGKGRIFGTTLGHLDDTMKTDVYLNLVTRGLLWACDKLAENGNPKRGFGKEDRRPRSISESSPRPVRKTRE
jgi:type 1 glutamine amidotransferase